MGCDPTVANQIAGWQTGAKFVANKFQIEFLTATVAVVVHPSSKQRWSGDGEQICGHEAEEYSAEDQQID